MNTDYEITVSAPRTLMALAITAKKVMRELTGNRN